MAEDLLPTDPEWVGPYRLLGRLGAGGMGEVYLARSPGGRLVAVKIIRPELAADRGFRARFAREAAAARTVSGVFTAPVVDADTEAPRPWLATAYVPGPSLAEAVAQRGPLPPGVVLTLGAGLAEGLQAIHAAGLVHRDLKPSNVLLADDGPRVIDFGIARAADVSDLTQTGMILGSPGFLSPEQAEGGPVGPPSDVFSLGSVLNFAASGEGPFGVGSVASLVYRVVNGEPNLSGVPEQLRPLIQRCLAKDPAGRPTAGELLALFSAAQPDPQWPSGAAGWGTRPDMMIAAGRNDAYGPPTQTSAMPLAGITPPAQAANRQTGYGGGNGAAAGGGQARPAPAAYGRSGGRRTRWALLAAAAVAVIAAASAGITLAASGGGGRATAGTSAQPTPSASLTATARPSEQRTAATASSPKATQPATSAAAAVAGVWSGTYSCNQGLTGLRLTITASGGNAVHAVAEFYPVASNPGTATGSYAMSGSYAPDSGLVLTPAYWISEPPLYVMVSLSAPPPAGNSMQGTVEGPNCTTFSLTR